jgi:type IV fimbrial biogenesis protein FimT
MANFYNLSCTRNPHRETGFSLVEVMVVTAIIGILVVTGISWGQNYTANNQVRAATESFQAALGLARSEAIQRNRQVNFVSDAAAQEWRVVTVAGANPAEEIRRGSYLDTRNIVGPGSLTVIFDAFGRAVMSDGTPIPAFNFGSTKGTCQPGGEIRCLRVVLAAGGQATTCDSALSFSVDRIKGCKP